MLGIEEKAVDLGRRKGGVSIKELAMKTVKLPLNDEEVKSLEVGEFVLLCGTIITARDRMHKWLYENFISREKRVSDEDMEIYERLKSLLRHGAIYHCGPIVKKTPEGWKVISAGPTTSEREEPYAAPIMNHFSVRAIIGKGGMGEKTLEACREVPAVYLHAIGGAAVIAAQTVRRVVEVFKTDFGMPEASWVLAVENFPAVVTMDARGLSLHREVLRQSEERFLHLISR